MTPSPVAADGAPLRVLLTTPNLGVGGAERVVVELANGLQARGDTVAVAAAPGPLEAGLDDAVERIVLPETARSFAATAAVAPRLARELRAFRPDAIHTQNVKSTVVAGTAARLASPVGRRAKVIATFHGVTPGEVRTGARLLRLADEVVSVSSDLAQALDGAGFPPARSVVIENAVPAPPPLSAERSQALTRELSLEGAQVVCAVGRLVAQKAHDRFVAAAALVARQEPGARFLILGEGALRAGLEAQIEQLGLGGRVTLAGVRDDAREVIALADLVVFSSDWEGLSLVALEALAAGTPVVATDVAGMRDLLGGGAGALAESLTPEALADQILALLRDPVRRATMGARGRELIESRFSLDGMVEAYRVRYKRLAARAA